MVDRNRNKCYAMIIPSDIKPYFSISRALQVKGLSFGCLWGETAVKFAAVFFCLILEKYVEKEGCFRQIRCILSGDSV